MMTFKFLFQFSYWLGPRPFVDEHGFLKSVSAGVTILLIYDGLRKYPKI